MSVDISEEIYRIRRMYPSFYSDPDFYEAKSHLRKMLGKNFIVIMEPRTVRVCYGSESVVI